MARIDTSNYWPESGSDVDQALRTMRRGGWSSLVPQFKAQAPDAAVDSMPDYETRLLAASVPRMAAESLQDHLFPGGFPRKVRKAKSSGVETGEWSQKQIDANSKAWDLRALGVGAPSGLTVGNSKMIPTDTGFMRVPAANRANPFDSGPGPTDMARRDDASGNGRGAKGAMGPGALGDANGDGIPDGAQVTRTVSYVTPDGRTVRTNASFVHATRSPEDIMGGPAPAIVDRDPMQYATGYDRLALMRGRGSRDTGNIREADRVMGNLNARAGGMTAMDEAQRNRFAGLGQETIKGDAMVGTAREQAQGRVGEAQAQAAGTLGAAQLEAGTKMFETTTVANQAAAERAARTSEQPKVMQIADTGEYAVAYGGQLVKFGGKEPPQPYYDGAGKLIGYYGTDKNGKITNMPVVDLKTAGVADIARDSGGGQAAAPTVVGRFRDADGKVYTRFSDGTKKYEA